MIYGDSKLPINVFSIISFIDKGYLFMILTSLRLNFLFDSLTFPFLRNRWHIENSKKVKPILCVQVKKLIVV